MISLFTSTRQWVKFTCGLCLGYGGVALVSSQVQLVVNTSESLPMKIFVQLKHLPPSKGDYTLVESLWYGKRLIKQVIGIPGDEITYDEKGTLRVNGKSIGFVKERATDGRVLTPISAQAIPEAHVFLYAPHPDSFDSRYEELGLRQQDELQGLALPVW